jgi:hypothetical protein
MKMSMTQDMCLEFQGSPLSDYTYNSGGNELRQMG